MWGLLHDEKIAPVACSVASPRHLLKKKVMRSYRKFFDGRSRASQKSKAGGIKRGTAAQWRSLFIIPWRRVPYHVVTAPHVQYHPSIQLQSCFAQRCSLLSSCWSLSLICARFPTLFLKSPTGAIVAGRRWHTNGGIGPSKHHEPSRTQRR